MMCQAIRHFVEQSYYITPIVVRIVARPGLRFKRDRVTIVLRQPRIRNELLDSHWLSSRQMNFRETMAIQPYSDKRNTDKRNIWIEDTFPLLRFYARQTF